MEAFETARTAFEIHGQQVGWRDSIWLAAYTIELIADGITVGIGDAPWPEMAQHWHNRIMEESPTTYLGTPLRVTSAADLARAMGNNSPELWRDAIDAWSDGSYHQAKARWRLAEALIETSPDDPAIESSLDLAQDTADLLGAQPLQAAIEVTRAASEAGPAQPGNG